MRIAFPVDSDNINDNISAFFARSRCYGIADTSLKSFIVVENPFYNLKTGVGTNVVRYLIENHDIEALVGVEFGINVQQLANANKINLIVFEEKYKSVAEILELMNF